MSGGALADDDVAALHGLRAQLEGMGHVLDTMATRTVNTDVGLSELQSKRYVLRLRSLHTAVILWLCHAGLLPEQTETDGAETLEFAYPGAALAQWYAERRRQLGRRQLMIDGLVEELGEPLRASWQEDGDGFYPPRSLQALTRSYLLDGVPDVRKHRLTHYLLLDLSRLVSDEHFDTLKSFPSSFAMSPSLIKLTHAFWHLDHGNVDSALVFLMDPLVQPGDLSAWQHRRIVESLLSQEAPRAALQYARARHLPAPHAADLRLHLRVLLDNGLVTEALRYERRHRALGGDQLADWLLGGCQQRRLLTQLMRQPLDAALERRFIEFLQDNVDKECAELLHVFYLQRGRYREAAGLQRRLAAATAPPAPERADFRQSLHQLLPALTHQRDGWLRAGPGRQGAPGARRQPLSAQLHQVPVTVRSRAILIHGLLEQEDREPAAPTVEATPFRPRHKRKMTDDDDDMGTPRLAQRRSLRPDVRRLLETPPVHRAPRRSDLEVGTPEARTPAAVMTPQSILKVRRYLEASGAARGEDTPSKQLRFGLLRGRRSLEESRADATPPPLATLFTPGKTPAPLRPPIRTPAASAATERSPSPATATAPVRLASLFTPGKTPRPLATHVGRLAEPRVTLADVWAAAERTPTPEPVSPPQKRQSLASELDDSEFYSFEASPTVANQTVEIFGRERKLRLVERSWHDESDALVTMGGDVSQRSHTGDADDTVNKERSSPALPEDGGQRHSTPQQEHAALRSPGTGGRLATDLSHCSPDPIDSAGKQLQHVMKRSEATDSTNKQLLLISPSPRRELHQPSDRSQTKQSPETPAFSRSRETKPEVSDKPTPSLEEGGRRVSGSSGEFSPLIGNKFTSLSMEGGLDALEAQILTEPMLHTRGSETDREKSPEQTGDIAPGEEPVILKRTAWVTGEEQDDSLSTLEAQVLTGTSLARPKQPTVTKVRQQSPGGEPVVVKQAAWVTGVRQDGGEPSRSLASLESQILTDTSVLSSQRKEPRRQEYSAGKEQVVVKQVAWVTGDPDQEEDESRASEEDTSPLSSSYLAPPAGMQAALERIDRALAIPESSISDAPTRPSLLSGGSSSELADCRMELRLEPDTDGEEEEEEEPTEGYTSLQKGPSEPAVPSSPGKTAASRLSLSSVLRPAAGSPLLTPRRSLRRRAGVTPLIEPVAVEGGSGAQGIEVAAATTTVVSSPKKSPRVDAPPPRRLPHMDTPSPKRSPRVVPLPPKSSAHVDLPSPKRSPRMDTPSPKRSPRVDTPSPKRSPRVNTPSPKRSPRVDMPSPKSSPCVDAPSPKKSPRVDLPAPKRSARINTPSPKRSPRVDVPSPKRPPHVDPPSPKKSPRVDTSSPERSVVVSSPKTTAATTAENSSPESSSSAKDSSALETQPSEHASPVAEIMSPSTSSQEESTEPSSSPEMKITSSSMPVSKVTTPTSSPPTRTSAPIRPARPDQTTLSPLAEEEPSEALLSPAADEAAPPPATPSNLRRRGRGSSAGPTTPRSRLSLLASVEPLSPVPEGQSVGAAAGGAAEPAVAEDEEADVEEPVPEPTPASTRKRVHRGSSIEPEVAPMSIRKSRRSRAASVGPTTPATPVRRSARSRGASLEPETLSATTDDVSPGRRPLRVAPVEMDTSQAPATPSRTVKSRQASEEPDKAPDTIKNSRTRNASQQSEEPPILEEQATSKRTRKTSETKSVGSTASVDASERGKSTKKASKELERQSSVETTAKARRARKPSEEPEEPAVLDISKRVRRTRKVSEEPGEPSELDTTQGTRRTRKASEEPEEPSVLDTIQRTRRTRKPSEEPEQPVLDTTQRTRRARKPSEEPGKLSVLDTTQKTRRTREASEEPEEPSILDTTQRTRRARKASEEPGEPSVLDTTQRTRQTRKTSEEPGAPSVLDTTQRTRRSRKASEEPGEPSVLDTTQGTRRTRKASEEPEEPSVLDTTQRTRRARKPSEEPEQPVLDTTQRTRRARKPSEEPGKLSVLDTTQKTRRTREASEEPEEPSILDTTQRTRRTRKASEELGEPSILDATHKGWRSRKAEEAAEASISESVRVRSAWNRKASDSSEAEVFVPASTGKRTRKQSQASEGSEDAGTPERSAKRVQRPAASPARSTRARSLSVQPATPERLPVRAASEQPPEDRPTALPPTKRARGSSSRSKTAAAVSAAAGEDGAPDAAGERSPSPPLRRRVAGRSSQSTGTARRSQLTAIVESAAETMPPPAAGSRRRRRRTTRPAPAEGEEETGSPVVLLTEEQLESLREREGVSPEPMSRDRRTSIARTRQRTGGRRSVRLW